MSYAHADALVSTDWVAQNLGKDNIRLVEIDVDTKQYDVGHIPGAVTFNWTTQLQDQVRRDILSKEDFEKLMSDAGIRETDTVVVYGDHNNWFAAYGFWLMKLYGHRDVRLMNGGRVKWLAEEGRPLTGEKPSFPRSNYRAKDPDTSIRARVMEVLEASSKGSANLIDVRSTDEYTGKVIAPPGMNETAQRAGHVPGARSVPWSLTVNQDGTFKGPDELRALYRSAGWVEGKPSIAYCRIGERSSHTWFVLKYLLGVKDCKNYDGSWTEYGNLIGAPIEKNV
ncbi:MAG TPA: sulfurtransferase [Phycisphaerales bacterium]|nr:sulfurtransferase [Phycisphaerales bacterium]